MTTRAVVTMAAASVLAAALTACGTGTTGASGTGAGVRPDAARPAVVHAGFGGPTALVGPASVPTVARRARLTPALTGVKALAVMPGRVLAATSRGLFDVSAAGRSRPVGTARDVLTALAADGSTLYASGQPAAGAKRAAPLGLIRSNDGGRTWSTVSLAGAQQFRSLAARPGLIVGDTINNLTFQSRDGGRRWALFPEKFPATIALFPDAVYVATAKGLQRTTSSGFAWEGLANAPQPWLIAADGKALWLVDPDGTVWRSHTDTAWLRGPTLTHPQALAASAGRAWVLTDAEVVELR